MKVNTVNLKKREINSKFIQFYKYKYIKYHIPVEVSPSYIPLPLINLDQICKTTTTPTYTRQTMRTVSGVTLRPDESEDKTFKKSLFYTFALVEPILPFLPKNISISLK